MARVTVVVPWRVPAGRFPDPQPEREAGLEWLARQVDRDLPGCALHIAQQVAEPWEFSKAECIRDAARVVGGDGVVVVHDADVWSPGLAAAVEAVAAGRAAWAMPHRRVYRLTDASTRAVLGGARPTPMMATVQRPYRGVCGGGLVVVPGWALEAAPPDPRFRGWGGEDRAWCDVLRTLVGPEVRGSAGLFHLWHPPFLNSDGEHRTTVENAALALRYREACHKPDAMAALLAESAVPA